MKKLKAFTLIELVVSLALTAVILGSVGTFLYFSLSMNGLLREQDRDYDYASSLAHMIREYANAETGKTYEEKPLPAEEVLLFNAEGKDYVYDNAAFALIRIEDGNRTELYNGEEGYAVSASYSSQTNIVEYAIGFEGDPILVFSVFLD